MIGLGRWGFGVAALAWGCSGTTVSNDGRPATGGAPSKVDPEATGVVDAGAAGVAGAAGTVAIGGSAGTVSDGGAPGDGGATSDGGAMPGTGGAAATSGPAIGRSCSRAEDCGSGAFLCLTPTSTELFGGGAPNGVCARRCPNGQPDCDATGSRCVVFGDAVSAPAFCVERCVVGPTPQGQVKCHGRSDVACDDNGETPFCRPTCRYDGDCGGQTCDLSSGICQRG